jgi:hypothetical protein
LSLPTRALRVAAIGAYVVGTTFSSLFVVPILAISALTFGIAGVVTPILGLIRKFGATWIQMALSFPIGLVIGVVCIGIAALSVAALRLYLQLLVRSFRIVAAQVLAPAMSVGDKSCPCCAGPEGAVPSGLHGRGPRGLRTLLGHAGNPDPKTRLAVAQAPPNVVSSPPQADAVAALVALMPKGLRGRASQYSVQT